LQWIKGVLEREHLPLASCACKGFLAGSSHRSGIHGAGARAKRFFILDLTAEICRPEVERAFLPLLAERIFAVDFSLVLL
jgi:hypothetical protein